jgi:hypothetical protein
MAKSKSRSKSHRHSRSCKHRYSRKQRGGAGMGDGYYETNLSNPQMSAAGTPLEVYPPVSYCGWDNGRVTPAVDPNMMSHFGGGRRRSRKQRGSRRQQGGGCGCMAQPPLQQMGGGSGTGGYNVDVTSNAMQKMYAAIIPGACPPPPRENQIGGGPAPVPAGSAADQLGIVSYKTGFGYNESSPVSTSSAHYLDRISYDRTCGQTGGKRKSRRHRKARRHGRK